MTKTTKLSTMAGLMIGCSSLLPAPDGADPGGGGLSTPRTSEQGRAHGQPARVLLLTIDGVRARDVFEVAERERLPAQREALDALSRLPNLTALAARGVAVGAGREGAPMRASGPNFVSLPGYTELLTGRAAPCQRNDCDERPESTLADAFAARANDPGEVAVLSSWSAIGRVAVGDRSRAVVSTGRDAGDGLERLTIDPDVSDALERGRHAGACPGHDDYRPDAHTAELALAYLRAEAPRFAFVALGDTDEHAHAGDYGGYLDALTRADHFVGEIDALAREWTRAGEPTVVVVTTDHGRAANFRDHGSEHLESRDVWMVAAGAGVAPQGKVALAREARLADLTAAISELGGVQNPTARDDAGALAAVLAPSPPPTLLDTASRRVATAAQTGGARGRNQER
jgi:uncharacterized protein (DUF1501 family)